MNCLDYFWGDSTLEKTEIMYDKISVTVFNDLLQKYIRIECSQCVGMSEIICWDETIIENITVNKLTETSEKLIEKAKHLYNNNHSDYDKPLGNNFLLLNILLINDISFYIICKEIEFIEQEV